MTLLEYYETYRIHHKRKEVLENQLQTLRKSDLDERARIRARMEQCDSAMEEIRTRLSLYVDPSSCPDKRSYYRLSDEQLFLECRYIRGMTIEQTAEAMCVSRDTAYRIRRRIAEKSLPDGLIQTTLPFPAA